MSHEANPAGRAFGVSGELPLPSWGRWVAGPAALKTSGLRSRLGPCGLGPYTFRVVRQNARRPRARGLIALLGGVRAERSCHGQRPAC